MNAPGTARGKDTRTVGELYMAFELGEKNWKLSPSDGAHSPSRYTVSAGDTAAVLESSARPRRGAGFPRRRACTVLPPTALTRMSIRPWSRSTSATSLSTAAASSASTSPLGRRS